MPGQEQGGIWRKIKKGEVQELFARVPEETAAKISGSKSFKRLFHADIDLEDVQRAGVYPKWLEVHG